jgi:hypothetical protein
MAYSTINKSSDYFNTKLYTGNSSTQSITGVGFQPDFTWIKRRDGTYNHYLCDAPRGAGKYLKSNQTSGETDGSADHLTAWTSDGFNLGGTAGVNFANNTFVSWNWKANGSGSANTDGSISSTVSANTTSGFSIVKFTTDSASGNATIGHGLGVVPKMIIRKELVTSGWDVFHESVTSGGVGRLCLHNSDDLDSTNDPFGEVAPTSSVFTYNQSWTGASGRDSIAYCFAEVSGYSKFGSYTHNGQSGNDGNFIYTGMKPKWLMLKNSSGNSTDWLILDATRSTFNDADDCLFANENSAESVNFDIGFLSNGFKLSGSGQTMGSSGNTVIYMAFGQPIVSGNDIPCTAR